MKTCETCKFWGDEDDKNNLFRECQAINHQASYDPYEENSDSALEDQLAITIDGSGYFAAIKTQADFGCVLHESLGEEHNE